MGRFKNAITSGARGAIFMVVVFYLIFFFISRPFATDPAIAKAAGDESQYESTAWRNSGDYVYVDAFGDCNGESPCFNFIQQAVDSATSGTVLWIYPEHYGESVLVDGNLDLELAVLGIVQIEGYLRLASESSVTINLNNHDLIVGDQLILDGDGHSIIYGTGEIRVKNEMGEDIGNFKRTELSLETEYTFQHPGTRITFYDGQAPSEVTVQFENSAPNSPWPGCAENRLYHITQSGWVPGTADIQLQYPGTCGTGPRYLFKGESDSGPWVAQTESVDVAGEYISLSNTDPFGYWGIGTYDVNIWTGSTDTDWHTDANWSLNAAPTAGTDVLIDSAPANQPIIDSAASCKSISIESGANLTLNNDDLTVSETLSTGAAGVTFAGDGEVVGAFKRTGLVTGTEYTFGHADTRIMFNGGTAPAEVTVKIGKSALGSAWTGCVVNRLYQISQSGWVPGTAEIQLRYTADDHDCKPVVKKLFTGAGDSGPWVEQTASVDVADGYISLSGLDAFGFYGIGAYTAPTDLALSGASVEENQAAGTLVGTFTTIDPESGDTFVYSLATGLTTEYCTIYTSGDVPKDIDPPAIQASVLTISADGTISDVNVVGLRGEHEYIDDMVIKLRSPNATVVNIMNRPCDDEDYFDLSLDDEASGPWPCPPSDGGAYLPSNPLSAFDGEYKAGDWTLEIEDTWPGSDSGQLVGWGLKFCDIVDLCADNDAFEIMGDQLRTKTVFDYETKSSYSICVETVDGDGESFTKNFTISVTDQSVAYADDDGYCEGAAPCFTDIGDALDEVGNSGLVRVYPGSYIEDVDLISDVELQLMGDVSLTGNLAAASGSTVNLDNYDLAISETLTLTGDGASIVYGTGEVVGGFKRMGISLGTAYTFGHPDTRITFNGGTPPTDVKLTLSKAPPDTDDPIFECVTNRLYHITANGWGPGTVDLQLRYTPADNPDSCTSLKLFKAIDPAGEWVLKGGIDTVDQYVTLTGVAELSYWAIGKPEATAVEISDFAAETIPEGVKLDWTTGSELIVLGFHLWKGDSNGLERVNATMIPAKNTGGFSGADYSYIDAGATGDSVYFIEVDTIDGKAIMFPQNDQPTGIFCGNRLQDVIRILQVICGARKG